MIKRKQHESSDYRRTDLVLRNIILPYTESKESALHLARKKFVALGMHPESLEIYRRSVDARKKSDIQFVYSVMGRGCYLKESDREQFLRKLDATEDCKKEDEVKNGNELLGAPVVVTGFGPCGMFAALALSRAGYMPIVLERGENVEARRQKVEFFFRTGVLDINSNVQFGAGGAGTFSDGKLVTRINDPLCRTVLEVLVEMGAPNEILTLAKPHIGTDKLLGIVKNIEKEIISLGGRVLYNTELIEPILSSDGRVKSLLTSRGELPCGALVLAVGHSARDTARSFMKKGFVLTGKDFSVGARIEHLQEDIDKALYGDADISILGHAEYSLSYREGERGVYSFCMCPGGEVICSSSEEGGLVVNGMSNFARNGRNANAAIAVSVLKKDYGGSPDAAIAYQERIGRVAFKAAGGGYKAPMQTLGDFLTHQEGSMPSRIFPTFRNGQVSVCDLHEILPRQITAMMEKGFPWFERQINGFSVSDALLTGVETRTSSPVRFSREENFSVKGHDNLYPGGEGAGYAGGITSAAVDGLRIARAIIGKYKQP